jgi:abortive infection bacteriophage resistance protein
LNGLIGANYYRLSAYFLPFKKADGNYIPGTDFNTVYQIYEFDRKLRNLIFAAIEEVEIYLRAKFAYYHAHKYGALGYMDAANYNQRHRHDRFKELIETEIKNNRKVLFVQHHAANYGGQFPVWVRTELFTFGMLSYFYIPANLPELKKGAERRLFGSILALKALYPNTDKWDAEIQSALCSLIESYSGITFFICSCRVLSGTNQERNQQAGT